MIITVCSRLSYYLTQTSMGDISAVFKMRENTLNIIGFFFKVELEANIFTVELTGNLVKLK